MASKLEIYQQALSLVGAKSNITSLTDTGREPGVTHCNTWEQTARYDLLRSYPWRWATGRVALTGETALRGDGEWAVKYEYPIDCIKVNRIIPEIPFVNLPPFSVGFDAAATAERDRKAIFTNLIGGGVAVITLKGGDDGELVPPYSAMPGHFAELLATKLASKIAFPITGKIELKASLSRMFDKMRVDFIRQDDEEVQKQLLDTDWIRARNAISTVSGGAVEIVSIQNVPDNQN